MKEMLQRNLGYKVISLVVAILFWLWVTSQGESQTIQGNETLTLSLVAKNVPANTMIMTKLPSVKVKTEGYNPSVNVNELYAYVDLSYSEPGEHDFEVKVVPIPNVTVVEISPKVVTLQLDTVQERQLPVTVEVSGTPAEGKKAGDPIVKPSVVNVRGPSSLLSEVDKVLVEINVAGISETLQVSRPLLFRDKHGLAIFGPDPSVETITASPSGVDIVVPIVDKELESKMVPIKATTSGTPAEGKAVRSIQVIPKGVQIYGEPEELAKFSALQLGAVNITGLSATKTFEISSDKVSLPEGLSYGSRTTFSVIVEIGNAVQEKTLYDIPIEVRNLSGDLLLDKPFSNVSVTVKGYPEGLETLTKEQISLWIDLSGKNAGEHTDKIYWQLPAGIEMVSVPDVTYSLKAKENNPENPGNTDNPDNPGNPGQSQPTEQSMLNRTRE